MRAYTIALVFALSIYASLQAKIIDQTRSLDDLREECRFQSGVYVYNRAKKTYECTPYLEDAFKACHSSIDCSADCVTKNLHGASFYCQPFYSDEECWMTIEDFQMERVAPACMKNK